MKGLGFTRNPRIRFDKLVTSVTCLRFWQSDFGVATGGTPLASGTTPPAVTVSGVPAGMALRIEIQTTGARGTATFRYSVQNTGTGAVSWIEQNVVTAATYSPIGALSGATFTFPNSTYTNDNVYEGTCSTWTDVKNSVGATQATAANQPRILSDVAGRLSLSFDGSNDVLNDTTLDLPAPSTTNTFVWGVFRQRAWSAGLGPFAAAQTVGQMSFSQITASPDLNLTLGINGPVNAGAVLNTLVRYEGLWSNSTSDYIKLAATTVSGTNVGNTNPAAGYLLGGRTTTASSSFDLLAHGVFQGKPSAAELTALTNAASAMYPGVSV